ncbi:MAG TPA: ferritin-like domain-containing protein [Thermoanaerobaculia bacterium]|jgi:ferritin-like metal-binding protein YciE|nr:ferritin-like domain-containing protein [Thermoanaerobaculia bacterium]
MANQDPRETLLSWLNDAYAMEKGLVQVLENHANDVKDRPEMYRRIAQHLEETKMHAERVHDCVQRLGGDVSTMKTAMGSVSGFFQGRSTGASPDELVKNALADYASEHLEIASYRALIVAARALGEQHVVQVCEGILRDEEEMARWLEQNLPMVVQEYLGQGATAGAGLGSPNMGNVRY